MPRLNGEQLENVYNAIMAAFDVEELERVLRFADIHATDANLNSSESKAIQSLLDEAERKGWISRLLEALKKKRPEDQDFCRIMDEALLTLRSQRPAAPAIEQPLQGEVPPRGFADEPRTRRGKTRGWPVLGAVAVLAIGAAGYAYFQQNSSRGPICGKGNSTVYIQYPDSRLKQQAEALRRQINQFGFEAPGTEKVGIEKSPSEMEIRYPSVVTTSDVDALKCIISYYYANPILSKLQDQKASALEVWFGTNQLGSRGP